MAEIRQDSFDETDRLVKVIFQTGRFVQEYELNEMQDSLRVQGYRSNLAVGREGVNTGWTVVGDSPTANQLHVTAGEIIVAGYQIRITSNIVVTGLTTPGGSPRNDVVYLELTEQEVNDPNPIAGIGVRSKRRQLTLAVRVAEGTTMPSSTGYPWEGGTYNYQLATVTRPSATATISSGLPVNTFNLLPGRICDEITTLSNGVVQKIHAGSTNTVEGLTASTPLRFDDPILTNPVDLSDSGSDNAGVRLRGPLSNTAVATSLVRMVNGRAFITLGDGSSSFGDISGADAFNQLVTFLTALSNPPAYVVVRSGAYTVSTQCAFSRVEFVGEGAGMGSQSSSGTRPVITNGVSAGGAAFSLTKCTLRGLVITRNATQKSLAGNTWLHLHDCTLTGGITMVDPRGEGLVIERCSVSETGGTGASITVSGVALSVLSPGTGITVRDSTFTHANSTSFLSIGTGTVAPPVYTDFVFERCSISISSSLVAGPPIRSTGLFHLADAAGATTSVFARSVQFINCVLSAASLLRVKVGVQESDDSSATESRLESVEFRGCKMLVSGGAANVAPFWYRTSPVATIPYAGMFVMDNCVVSASQFQVGVESGGAAYFRVETTYATIRDVQFDQIRNDLFSSAIGVDPQSVIRVVPTVPSSGNHRPYAKLQGIALERPMAPAATATVREILYVDAAEGLVHVSEFCANLTGLANPYVGSAMVNARGTYTMTMRTCMLYGNSGVGILVPSADDLTLDDCYVSGVTGVGISISSNHHRVLNCRVASVGGIGIDATTAVEGMIRGCLVRGCTGRGIRQEGENQHVQDNKVYGNNGGAGNDQIQLSRVAAWQSLVCTGNSTVDPASGTMGNLHVTNLPTVPQEASLSTQDGAMGTRTSGQVMWLNNAILVHP